MITLPDFKEKKILFVQSEYSSDNLLQLNNDNIRFLRDGKVVDQISFHSVFAIFIIGDMSITTSLLKKLSSYGISVFFLNRNLSVKAKLMAEAEGNWILRQKQYNDDNSIEISLKIINNKLINQEVLLKKLKKIIY